MIDKNTDFQIVNLPPFPGEAPIHIKAGLRISSFQREAVYPPLDTFYRRKFQFYSLSHLIRGKGWYWTPRGGYEYFSAGQGVMIAPDFIHCYGGYDSEYVEDSLCIEGPLTRYLAQSGILRNGILHMGRGRRLLPLIELASDPSDDSQLKANAELIRLLTELHLENRLGYFSKGYDDSMEGLILEIRHDPGKWWSLDEMASYCGLSINYFRTLFTEKTGHTPRDYQEEVRIRRSRELLSSPLLSISCIAERMGYRDVYHFSKVFKKRTGLSPRSYRREHSLSYRPYGRD